MTQKALDATLVDSRILVVDDEPQYRTMMVRLLTRAGIRHIETASDGRDGLAKLESFKPDLIILDINMPVMNGYEMCRQLRATPATADVPILFQTGATTEEEQSTCFAAGGSDYIAKPIRVSECLARIAVHLRMRQMMLSLQSYASRVESELSAARAMQSELTPPPARVRRIADAADLQIDIHVEPSSELGGDTWAIDDLGQGRIALMLADFSGHGIAAAINTFRLHTLISQHPPNPESPGDWLGEINNMLCGMLTEGQFAAFFYGVLEPAADRLRYAACGGPNPVIVDGGGPRMLDGSGLMLGITQGINYETREVMLPVGAALLLYSDALTESESPDADALGHAGVLDLYRQLPVIDSSPIRFLLDRGLQRRRPLKDDLTMIWISRQPKPPP
jgi:sigma-B regulation protein RsbU (phosphoserine phosphatase)